MPTELRREISSCVYRVAQESLSNIARHAGATRVSVILEGAGRFLRLRVKDSGFGFKTESRENRLGLGLLGMEERVGLLRGRLTICSQPGKGTEITVEIPVEA
jgi:signal transduction histidine kinase